MATGGNKLPLTILMIVILAVSVVCFATGCRASDALKEIVYDQSSSDIDYENPTKYYINDSTSTDTSDDVSAEETSKTASETKEKQNIVVYSSTPNSKQYKAKKSVFDTNPDFTGIEASEGVSFYKSDDKDAVERKSSEKKQENDSSESQETSDNGSGATDQSGETPNSKGDTEAKDTSNGGGSGGEVTVNDTTGKYTDPSKVDHIAAFGQAAVIVQMVGGEGALVAADKTLLSSSFKKVFSDEGASDIKQGWSDAGTVSKIDVDAIIASKADTILAYSSDYLDKLSSADKKKLNAAGITVTVIPALTNSTYIKQAVDTVAEMLSESTVIGNAGQTESIADEYDKFHDDLVDACVEANDGDLAGTQTYEKKNSVHYSYDSSAEYTLLIDGYDTSAKFKGSVSGWTPVSNGVALATIGWSSSPVSYYIQAGGLVNNAAAQYTASSTGKSIVWQFNTNLLPFDKDYWSYSKNGALAAVDSSNLDANKGAGWGMTLLTVPGTVSSLSGNSFTSSFGTADFPKLIAATVQIKDKIIANSKNSNGIYHPYDLVTAKGTGTSVSAFGKLVGSTVVYSCIGADNDNSSNLFEDGQISDSSIVVNPHGLFSSWIDGGVESVLEAAWVNDTVEDNSTSVDVKQEIEDFYSTFYRYDLSSSQVEDILDGEEK